MKILVYTAFPEEARHFLIELESVAPLERYLVDEIVCVKQIRGEDEIFFAHTGLGTEDAAITTTLLISAIKPDVILMCGTAGGAEPSFEVGDLILGAEIIHGDLINIHPILASTPFAECLINPNTGKSLEVAWKSDERLMDLSLATGLPKIKRGNVFSSNFFPSPEASFDEIKKRGGGVLEMESAGVFRAAERCGKVPCLAARAVSNLLDEKGKDRGTPAGGMEICAKRLADFLMTVLPLVLEHKRRFDYNGNRSNKYNG